MKKKYLYFLLALIIISSCVDRAPLKESAQPPHTPSPSNSPRPAWMRNATEIIQTKRAEPSSTPENTKTITPTAIPLIQTAVAATRTESEFQRLKNGEFPPICAKENQYGLVSPDGEWLAVDCEQKDRLLVTNRDGSKVWEIQHLHKMAQSPDGEKYEWVVLYSPYYWTHDSQYLYYQPYVCCTDVILLGSLPRPLDRLSIQSGYRNVFIKESASDVTFSPKNKYVAFFTNDHEKLDISIHSLKNGKVNTYFLEGYDEGARIIWSQDESKIAFVTSRGNYYEGESKYWILLLDIESGQISEIVSNSDIYVYPFQFIDDDRTLIYIDTTVQLFSWHELDESTNKIIYYDLINNKIMNP